MTPDPNKWYFKTSVYIIAFLCVGPFALPLAWINPRYNTGKKIIITLVTLIITGILAVMMAKSIGSIMDYYRQMQQLMK